jgi:hypothetical protein
LLAAIKVLVSVLDCMKVLTATNCMPLFSLQDDDNAPDREQDIKPRFHQPRIHGVDGPEEDEVCCD